MKKNLTAILTAAIISGAFTVTASADTAAINVYVTISDGSGRLVLTDKAVEVTDINGDGVFNIDEALFAAHEQNFPAGDTEGYYAYDSDYGRSLGMLWGDENGSYGYYVNNASAMSLGDEVKNGDYINAFCYTDLTTWSDTYCFFDTHTTEGNEFTLTLSAAGWDENYNPVTLPVEGAVITVDGEKTDFVTDAEGKVTVTIDEAGSYVISAVSDTQILVPPVCIAEVAEADAGTSEASPSNPSTGVSLSFAAVAAAGAAFISRKRK